MFGSRTTTSSQFVQTASRSYRWKSAQQAFVSWDKNTETEIVLSKDDKLIPLTATMSVTGVHERDHGKVTMRFNQVYSNEFTNTRTDMVKVVERDKLDGTKTVIAEGVYNPDVKDAIADLQYAKFTKNIYCLLNDDVVRISLVGASLKPWIDFENSSKDKGISLYDGHYFCVSGSTAEKNGAVSFNSPIFSCGEIDKETNEKANQAAIATEEAIIHNKQANGTEEPTTVVNVTHNTESNHPAQSAQPAQPQDEPISLDEIPF